MLIEEAIKRLELMLVASVDSFNDSIATGFNADSPISPDEDETETFRSYFEKEFEAYRIAITVLKTQLSQEATTKGTTCDLISRQAAIDALDCINGVEEVLRSLPSVQPEEDWIPVSKDMPVEYDSVFTKFHGTDKWRDGMWLKSSARVLVTVEFEDGTRMTETAKTIDGKWATENRIIKRKVVAWKKTPKEYKGK